MEFLLSGSSLFLSSYRFRYGSIKNLIQHRQIYLFTQGPAQYVYTSDLFYSWDSVWDISRDTDIDLMNRSVWILIKEISESSVFVYREKHL